MEKLTQERHVAILKGLRRFYSMRGMKQLEQKINHLIRYIQKEKKINYLKKFDEIETIYDKEIKQKGDYEYNSYTSIKKIYIDAIKKGIKPLLEDVKTFGDDWAVSNRNLQRMSKIANSDILSEAKFLIYCFVYLIYCEGGYKNWIRILFYLLCNSSEETISLDDVNQKSLSTIKDMMIKRGVNKILFEGYLNGEIRNGIAHGHLSYDEKTKKMRIQDRKHGKICWENSYTLNEFYKIGFKIAVIPDICYEIFLLLAISDICILYQDHFK